jgi:hypothetical protein
MNTNYDCQYYYNGQPFDAFIWQTLNVQISGSGPTPTCTYSVYTSNQSYGLVGGDGTLTVNTQSGCTWTATRNVDWITFTSNASGSGSGSVTFSVAQNPGVRRAGLITVEGKSVSISQAGPGTLPNPVRNPSFENGEDGNWINSGYIIWEVPCPAGIDCAYQGNWLAWLGGYDCAYDWLYQVLTIPYTGSRVALRFKYAIDTWENPLEPNIYDTLELQVNQLEPPYESLTLLTLSNRDWTDFWKSTPFLEIPPQFLGVPISIDFIGQTDECYTGYSNITSFYIDNVTLEEPVYPYRLNLPLLYKP